MAKKKKGNGGSQAFAVAQQIGKSLFLPIAVLPPAGILLGIGSSFTNSTTIATYGLSGILHEGNPLYMFFQLLNGAGNAVFGNLALIFALAVALGMAKKEKGVAVLSAAIYYLIMLTTMNVLLQIDGSILADGRLGEKDLYPDGSRHVGLHRAVLPHERISRGRDLSGGVSVRQPGRADAVL